MRHHEITDNDAFVGTTAKTRAGQVETKLPCGWTIKADQHLANPTQWSITLFSDVGREVTTFGLKVTPSNANAVYNFLRRIVHLTPGIEEKA